MRLFSLVLPPLCVRFAWAVSAGAESDALGPSSFAVQGTFPTSVFSAYYNNPTAASAQPQPIIFDPVSVCFRLNIHLTSGLICVGSTKSILQVSLILIAFPK